MVFYRNPYKYAGQEWVNPAVLEILRASEAIEWVDAGDIQVNQARGESGAWIAPLKL